jgi:multidrug resistance efflux pump
MKRRWVFIVVLVVIVVAAVAYSLTSKEKSVEVTAVVESGQFDVIVSTTGELAALNSVDIRGPEGLRDSRIHEVKIVDLVPEGTVVKQGDFVCSLDKTAATTQLQNIEDQIERDEASLRQAELDTTMSLRDYRNQIKDLEYDVEEKQIILDQSQYEPPATIRSAEMNLDKAKRALDQAVRNYSLRKEQAEATVLKADIALRREYQQRNEIVKVLNQFTVYAPQDGMVIYKKEWGGTKRKVGTQISFWDPVVATLPDLTKMITKTYVNEIDISKIKTNQTVAIGIDAFPDRQYTGIVTEVANVGEQLPNSDAKVFEVVIAINETDTTLRPGMTTVTQITTNSYDDVRYLPLEAIHSNDSLSYVLKVKDKIKQIVDLGEANENYIIVVEGLDASEEVYLTIPEGSDEWKISGLDIYEKIKVRKQEEEKRKKEEMEKMRREQEERAKILKDSGMGGFNMQNMTKEQREQMQKMMQGNGGAMRMMPGGQARQSGGERPAGSTQAAQGGEVKTISIQR